jgi:tRNA A-37 threonylcarbamoyl transferase component Bud32
LVEVPANNVALESAESAVAALVFAEKRIHERLESTLSIRKAVHGHVETVSTNADAIVANIALVLEHAKPIGAGADGRVVIDTRDAGRYNPEICYKFALEETLKRGRNSMVEEIEMQCAFYEAAQELPDKRIGVPEPFFEVDIGSSHILVMEKLFARSVDDILRGEGTLPDDFDVDVFCEALKSFLEAMHERGLYHRDLHYGNIMITQPGAPCEQGESKPLGYVIDFGLSGYGVESMDPYKKDMAGMVFTYDQDYGRIEGVRFDLKALQIRQKGT